VAENSMVTSRQRALLPVKVDVKMGVG
jgi:hypothetical protein